MASTLVFATGLDRGAAGAGTTYGLMENDASPGVGLMEWQTGIKESGDGAYHWVGGNLGGEKVLKQDANDIFGALEVWTCATVRFAGFPASGVAQIFAARPTDGMTGAVDMPVVGIASTGKLRILNSGTPGSFSETTNALIANTWYFIVLHAKNGVSQTQGLTIYSTAGATVQALTLVMSCSGATLTKDLKLGMLNTADLTGLEFYADSPTYFSGDTDPGPVRVAPKKPLGTAVNDGFTVVGAGTVYGALQEAPQDGDTTYILNPSAAATRSIVFDLEVLGLSAQTATIRGVQSNIIHKLHTTSGPITTFGVRVSGVDGTGTSTPTATYAHARLLHPTNPNTGAPWLVSGVDAAQGLIQDAESGKKQFRVTNAWWDVIYTVQSTAPAGNIKRLTTDGGIPTGTASGNQANAIRAYLQTNPWGTATPRVLRLEGFYRIDSPLRFDATCPSDVLVEPEPPLTVDDVGFERIDYFAASEVGEPKETSSCVFLQDAVGWTLKNITVKGPHTAAKYSASYESSRGIGLNSAHNCTLDGVKVRGTGSDFIIISGDTGPTQDCVIKNLNCRISGRQGISPVNAQRITIQDSTLVSSPRSFVDLEAIGGLGWFVDQVTLRNSTFEDWDNAGVAYGGSGTRTGILVDRCTFKGGAEWISGGVSGHIDDGFTVLGKNDGTNDYHYLGNIFSRVVVGSAKVDRTEEAYSAAGTPFALFGGANEYTYFAWHDLGYEYEFDIAAAGSGLGAITWEESRGPNQWVALSVISDASSGFTLTGKRIIVPGTTNQWQRTSVAGAPGDFLGEVDSAYRWDGAAWSASLGSDANNIGGSTQIVLSGLNDRLFVGAQVPFEGLKLWLLPVGAGLGTVTYEYWNGTAWSELSVTDNTSAMTLTRQTVAWTEPGDWVTNVPSESGLSLPDATPYYYVRIRCSQTPTATPRFHAIKVKDTSWFWLRVKTAALGTSPTINAIRFSKRAAACMQMKNTRNILIENTRAVFSNSNPGIIGAHTSPAGDGVLLPGIVRNNIFTTVDTASPVSNVGPEITSTGNIGIPNQGGTGTLPAAPINPSFANVTQTTLDFSVVDASDTPGAEDGFRARYRITGSQTWVTLVDKSPAAGVGTTITWNVTGLSASTTYDFEAWAFNAVGDSGRVTGSQRTLDPVPPTAPTGLVAGSPTQSSIALTWVDNATTEDAYEVQRRLTADAWGGASTVTTALPVSSTSYTATGLASGTSYTFRVRCKLGVSYSAFSNEAAQTTANPPPPNAPSSLVVTSVAQTSAALQWADNATDETAYQTEYKETSSGTWLIDSSSLPADSTSRTVGGLTANTSYDFRVACSNAFGLSGYSNIAQATTLAVSPPATPTGLTAGTPTAVSVPLTWTDAATDEDAYEVEHRVQGASAWVVDTTSLAANTQAYTVTGLLAGTPYEFRVRCSRTGTKSAYSNIAAATTIAPEPVAPVLSLLEAPAARRLVFTFTDVSNELGYEVSTSPNGTDTWTVRLSLAPGSTSAIWDGASPSTLYYGRVSAIGNSGARYHGNVLNVTTPPDQPPPNPPSGTTVFAPVSGPFLQSYLRLRRLKLRL